MTEDAAYFQQVKIDRFIKEQSDMKNVTVDKSANDNDKEQIAPEGTFMPMLMSMAIPKSSCLGPCRPKASDAISPVWYWNRSTVWQA